MTTYTYNIRFNDSEMTMLTHALKNMIAHCEEQLKQGKGAPYWAHKHSAEAVLKKMHDDVTLNSFNTFK